MNHQTALATTCLGRVLAVVMLVPAGGCTVIGAVVGAASDSSGPSGVRVAARAPAPTVAVGQRPVGGGPQGTDDGFMIAESRHASVGRYDDASGWTPAMGPAPESSAGSSGLATGLIVGGIFDATVILIMVVVASSFSMPDFDTGSGGTLGDGSYSSGDGSSSGW